MPVSRAAPTNGGTNGNEAGAERLVAYQKFLRRGDISLTHTIVQPTVDKATGDAPSAGNAHALRKVGETEHGIVVRGARVLATLAPFADEIAVYPAAPLPQGADDYALSFCIPMGTPGTEIPLPRFNVGAGQSLRPSRCPAASTNRMPL
jgi:4-hydroxyphenylacetate 3-monooxygenase